MIESEILKREGSRFLANHWKEGSFYDCVSFVASVYISTETISPVDIPSHKVFGLGKEMLDLTCRVIEETKGFEFAHDSAKHGDLVIFSREGRSPHAGIVLKNNRLAHCVHGRGVVIDTFTRPLVNNIYQVYRPKNHASL